MKGFFLIACLFINFVLPAQSNFAGQITALIADSANGFAIFRGDESPAFHVPHNRYFSVTIQVEGTFRNRIFYSGGKTFVYETVIADSLGLRKARKLADRWKKKIEAAIDPTFAISQYKNSDLYCSRYGWKFSKGRFEIVVDVFPLIDTKLYIVYLILVQSN